MTFYVDDALELHHGDALEVLRTLPDGHVDCIVTSPPYYGLRDYGADGQYGHEATPAEYVETMRAVFAEARRVLADDGTLWLNLGDSYATRWSSVRSEGGAGFVDEQRDRTRNTTGLPDKNLIGVPWRVAFALQDEGWILRNEIIWAKPNGMPESVSDRLAGKHEHLFLFAKSARYHFDLDAIREPHSEVSIKRAEPHRTAPGKAYREAAMYEDGANPQTLRLDQLNHPNGKNPGDVWSIPTTAFPGAHFATFPVELARRAIAAGCKPSRGCDCDEVMATPAGQGQAEPDPSAVIGRGGLGRPRRETEGVRRITRREQRGHADQLRRLRNSHNPVLWARVEEICGPGLDHYIRTDKAGARPLPPHVLAELIELGWIEQVPPCEHPPGARGVVLDPFSGSGTTGLAAAQLGRRYVGIDLSEEYLQMSLTSRLGQAGLPL